MDKILRQTILLLACLCFILNANAQLVANYTFESSQVSYNPILGGSTLASGTNLDAEFITTTIPFSFNFDGTNYSSCSISTNGYIVFNGTGSTNSNNYPIESTDNIIVIAPMSMNLTGIDGNSAIKVLSTGISPNRIFTIEWRNLDVGDSGLSALNFQLKLYQTTNEIRFIYGSCSSGQNLSPQIGLRHTTPSNAHIRTNNTGDWLQTTQSSNNLSRVVYNANSNPPLGLAYTFTPGLPQPCTAPAGQPGNLVLTSTINSVSGSFTAALAHWYLVVRTPNEPLVGLPVNGTDYSINAQIGNGVVVAKTSSTTFGSSSLVENTYYRYTIFAFNMNGCVGGPAYNVINPPTQVIRTLGSASYTYSPVNGSTNFANPSNWTPTRITPMFNDTLVFNSGGTVTVTNVSDQSINSLIITNSGNYTFIGTTCYLSIRRLLQIDEGSQLNFSASVAGGIDYIGNTNVCEGRINGTLRLNGVTNYDGSFATTMVHGTIEQAGIYCAVVNSNANPLTNFIFEAGSTYIHSRDGGNIPNANYKSNSNLLLSGIFLTAPFFGTNSNFGNFTFDAQNSIVNSFNFLNNLDTIRNNLTILNAQGKSLTISGGSSTSPNFIHIKGDFIQNSGIITTAGIWRISIQGTAHFNDGGIQLNYSGLSNNTLSLNGNVNQSATHSLSASAGVILQFAGNNQQLISFNGPLGTNFNYQVNNASGIVLNNDINIGNGRYFQLINGSISGTGQLIYNSVNSRLYYSGPNQLQITDKEWPQLNGPKSVNLNLTGPAPLNRIALINHKNIDSLTIVQGVLVLNDFNLSLNIGVNTFISPELNSSNRIVVTNGLGELRIQANTNLSTKKTLFYPVGYLAETIVSAYVSFDYYRNDANRFIGIRAYGGNHPENTENDYINKYWRISDSGIGNTLVYGFHGSYLSSEVVGETTNVLPNLWNGNNWQRFAGSIVSAVNCDTLNTRNLPLDGNDICAFKRVNTTYSWTGDINDDYQNPLNWNPARNIPDQTDLIEISTGEIDTLINIPSEQVSALSIRNNTTAVFQSMNLLTSGIVYHINFLERQDSLQLLVESGSSLILANSPKEILLTFGVGKNDVYGNLEIIRSTTIQHQLVLSNSITHIHPSGKLKLSGTIDNSIITTTSSLLKIDGLYEHSFTSNILIPSALWGAEATILFNGFTNSFSAAFPVLASIPTIIYNCPNQVGPVTFINSMPQITNSFQLISTGTSKLVWGGNSSVNNKIENFYQSGGSLELSQGTSYSRIVEVTGNFEQIGGTFSSQSTSGFIPVLKFTGTSAQQNVSFFNASPAGRYSFQVVNPHGIHLTGNDFLTDTFLINTLSEVRYTSIGSIPVETSLIFKYSDNSSLYYDSPIGRTASDVEFPEFFGPENVYANHPAGQVLRIPFDRTIPRKLYLYCDVLLNEHALTIGVSGSVSGEIFGTKLIELSTGSITRWFSIGNVPLVASSSKAIFPVMNLGRNRSSSVYFNDATSITQSGTIRYEHNDQPGIIEGLQIQDSPGLITSRTQAFWKFYSSEGFAAADSSINLELNAGNMILPTDSLDIHVVKANSAIGTHQTSAGLNPNIKAFRKNMSLANLTDGEFYLGSTGHFSEYFISVLNGNFSDPSIWNLGMAPGYTDNAFIGAGTTVLVAETDSINSLGILNYGTLEINGGTLIAANSLINNGNFHMTEGLFRIGLEGGWKSEFINNNLFQLDDGIVEVNGNMLHSSVSKIIQHGGALKIDGNAQSTVENSVANGKDLLAFNTSNIELRGGIIQLIDPHVLTTSNTNYSFMCNASSSGLPSATCGPNHKFIFGDGSSTDTSTSILGFRIRDFGSSTFRFVFDTLEVLGTPNTNFRNVTTSSNSLNVLSKLELKGPGSNLTGIVNFYIAGDIHLQEGSQFQVTNLNFVDPSSGSIPTPVDRPQTVNAPGGFYPGTNSTTSFTSLTINNISPEGVRFINNNITVTSQTYLLNGKLDLDTNKLITSYSSSIPQGAIYNGWVKGKIQINSIPNSNAQFTLPFGNDHEKIPIEIAYSTRISGNSLLAFMKDGDSPTISSSPILENKTVNRNYFFSSSGNLNLSNDARLRLKWASSDVDTGLIASNLIAVSELNGAWMRNGNESFQNNSLLISNLGNALLSNFQLGEPNNIPVLYNQSESVAVCENSDLSLQVNAGNFFSQNYQWQQFMDNSWIDLTESENFQNTTMANLPVISTTLDMDSIQLRCRISTAIDTVYSSPIMLSVLPYVESSNTIESLMGPQQCEGALAQFNLNIENGGENPFVLWYKNGVLAQYNSLQYADSTLIDNDILSCFVLSDAPCLVNSISESPVFEIEIIEALTPQITVTPENGLAICEGVESNFSASAVNGGDEPIYSWYLNGVFIGNEPSISIEPQQNNFAVRCVLQSNYTCLSTDTASSENIQIDIQNTLTPAVSVNSSMGISICEGTPTEIFANGIHGGNNPLYQWIMNDVEVGTNSPYLPIESFESGDEITCIFTSNANCISESQVSSNTLVLQSIEVVTPTVSISVSPAGTLAYGTPVTFTPTLTNCGQSPVYVWIKNGVVVGNYSTYSSQQLHAGDTISLRVYSTIFCTTNQIAYSNSIGMEIISDIQNIHQSTGISISPNPSNGILNLNMENYQSAGEDFNLSIFSMDGKLIYSKNHGKLDTQITSIDLRNVLSKGIYLLRYNSSSSSGVVRFVVSE